MRGRGKDALLAFLMALLVVAGLTIATMTQTHEAELQAKRTEIEKLQRELSEAQTQLEGLRSQDYTQLTQPSPRTEAKSAHGEYIANKKTMVFHKSSCVSLPEEKNREYISERSSAVAKGYKPCKNCEP